MSLSENSKNRNNETMSFGKKTFEVKNYTISKKALAVFVMNFFTPNVFFSKLICFVSEIKTYGRSNGAFATHFSFFRLSGSANVLLTRT